MKEFLLSAAALVAMSATSSAVWAQQPAGSYHGPHMWYGGPWMFVGPLMMIIFIAAAVVMVVLVIHWLGGSGHSTALHPSPGRAPLGYS